MNTKTFKHLNRLFFKFEREFQKCQAFGLFQTDNLINGISNEKRKTKMYF